MRVVLVNPPQDYAIDAELPWYIRASTGIFPPLGLMYIASYLKKHNCGCQVAIVDSIARGQDIVGTLGLLFGLVPDIIGITVHTQNLITITKLVRKIKQWDPHIHIVLGGPHVAAFPEASLGIIGVDTVVIGEGETSFSQLVDVLSQKGDLNEVHGIVFKENGNVHYTDPYEPLNELDNYPFPYRARVDLRKYSYVLGTASGLSTTMISSRGCVGRCIFCSTPRWRFRKRSPENIADEMEECVNMGIKEINFVDDTFNADPLHAAAVCHEIKRRKLPVRWGVRARADKLSERLLRLLKESGCYRVNIGVETSSNYGLNVLCKGITVAQVRDAFWSAKKAGLITVAYFMLGCPHEKTRADVNKTIDFAIELAPDYAMFNILTLYPGTFLYEDGVRRGIIKRNRWEAFVEKPRQDFLIPFWEEWLSREELQGLLREAYRKFYFRPKSMVTVLKNTCGISTLLRKTKIGMDILKGAD